MKARIGKVTALVMLGVLIGAGAVWARGSASEIAACVEPRTNYLKLGSSCGGQQLTWNTEGPKGDAGPAGAPGPAGLQGKPGERGAAGPKGDPNVLRIQATGGPKKLTFLLTLEQQLLLKLSIRLAKIEKKLNAQDAKLADLKQQLTLSADYARTRLYENCISINNVLVGPPATSLIRCGLGFYAGLSGYDPMKKATP